MRFVLDIESSDLLQNGLDYSSMPYRLKPDYKVWCIVLRTIDGSKVSSFHGDTLTKDHLQYALQDCREVIGHHIVGFDLPVLQLYGLIDYTVGYPGQSSTLFGKPVVITDTLIWSKLLNPDRFGGHGLDAWGKRLDVPKYKFNDWTKFSEEMLDYCIQDTNTNREVYKQLVWEQGNHDWSRAYSVELKLADLTLKQELFGFHFNTDLAFKNLEELRGMMQEIAAKVDPLLPPKRLSKVLLDYYTGPKLRFKKDGTVSANLIKFVDKIGAKLSVDRGLIILNGKEFPIETTEPLKEFEPATVEDIDVVKSYLLNMGWEPTEIKERDLVKNANKSVKSRSEVIETIDRYVEQTETGLFKQLRLGLLETTMPELRKFLIKKIETNQDGNIKPIYVPTAPKLTVGLEKEICPNLIALGEKAEFVADVVKYYTYRHRKNSIAGGAVDEDGEPETGFISNVREDGRIPTPADTLGANTGRYKHKIVCNVPRVTSLYGEQMRNLFGCGPKLRQIGYDFASLEARIMGHYVLPYTDGAALAEALVAEKPNDIHSINAKKLGIDRSSAKSFSYAAIYGAQPKKLAKMLGISLQEAKKLFEDYWDAVPALKELKEKVEKFWEAKDKKFIVGLDGRKLITRSKHSLINVLFQSGGAISAKWSAVNLAQELEEQGLLGNPLQHSKEDVKVWWMIHMHDEQQLAVHPSLLEVQSFASDAEAAAARQALDSAVGHGKKGSYIGKFCKPVECIDKGIKRACQDLKLRVDLGFEWIPGMSWGQCH